MKHNDINKFKNISYQLYIFLTIVCIIILTHIYHDDIIRMYSPSDTSINSYGLLYGDINLHTSYQLYLKNTNINNNKPNTITPNIGNIVNNININSYIQDYIQPSEKELQISILSPIRGSIVPLNNRLTWQISGDLIFKPNQYLTTTNVNTDSISNSDSDTDSDTFFNRKVTTEIYIDGKKLSIPFDGLLDNMTLSSVDSIAVVCIDV